MPTGLEIWILKWIVAPFIAVILLVSFIGNSNSINRCEARCTERGYADFRHVGSGVMTRRACYCLTEEESKEKPSFNSGTLQR